jgi:hypothetical protein
MGIVQYFEAYGYKFYEPIPGDKIRPDPVIGQICWAPILHIDTIPRVFELERHHKTEHEYVNYNIRNMKHDDFTGRNRLPLKLLKLRERQEAIIHGASKRPCILLHYGETIYNDLDSVLAKMARTHLQRKNNMLLLPLYGVQDEKEHFGGFPPVMVARIRAMLYDQFLFFPGDGTALQKDSISRFDGLQSLVNHFPACDFKNYKVTADFFAVIIGMLKRWFNLEVDQDFNALVEICNATCPEDALPKGMTSCNN